MKLVEANEAQKRARDRLTHAEWGKKLTPDEYAVREERLRAHRWSRKAMQTWLLVDGDQVLASCETFRMESFVRQAPGHSYGVASVYTEPTLRGRGHATRMMDLLQEALAKQDPRVQSSILFSDVGRGLYERSGYQAREGNDRWFAAAASPVGAGAIAGVGQHRPGAATGATPSDQRGGAEQARGLEAIDGAAAIADHRGGAQAGEPITEATLSEELASVPRPNESFLIWPTAEQLDWHLERERIYAETLRRQRPPSVGARVGQSRIFWCGYYASDLLAVLLMHAASADDAKQLLRAAQRAAASAGLTRVLLWESAAFGDWKQACADVPSEPREGYLPMIRPFVTGASAETWNFIPRALWI